MRPRLTPIGIFLVMAVVAAMPALGQTTASRSRQAEVERRGATVMPFDQKRAMHMFRQTRTGGVLTVMSKDGDPVQIAAIRSHLRHEAAAFARGDYTDPMAIHGARMPGVAVLRAAGRTILVVYRELPQGAMITFMTRSPVVLTAVHAWFAAQVSDHGVHAMMMH